MPYIEITWVPTVPNCHLAMTIALSITTKLGLKLHEVIDETKTLNPKIRIHVQEGKHETKPEIDKQVNDKERVGAAMENEHLSDLIYSLISKDYS